MKKVVILLLIATAAAAYAADTTKLSPDLQKATSPTARVVVQYNNPPGQLDLQLLSLLGSVLNSLPLVNGVVADLPCQMFCRFPSRAT